MYGSAIPTTDQRGVNRGTTTDIGAYQATSATQLGVSGFPGIVKAGDTDSFTATAEDQFGKTVYGYQGTVEFQATGQANLPAPATLTNGTGTFMAALNTPGVQAIVASDAGNSAIQETVSIVVLLFHQRDDQAPARFRPIHPGRYRLHQSAGSPGHRREW